MGGANGRRRRLNLRVRVAHVPNPTLTPLEVVRALLRPMDLHEAESAASKALGVSHAILFKSARGALAAACAALARDGEVALPAYTCIAVANAIRSAGAHPVYVDVDRRGLVPAAWWPQCDLVITQDTYGFRAQLPASGLVVRDASHRTDLLRTRGGHV